MPARSASQQRLFGMIHAYQQGKLKHPSDKIKEMSHSIKPQDVSDFAVTKHEGLPERIEKSAGIISGVFKYCLDRGFDMEKTAGILESAASACDLWDGMEKKSSFSDDFYINKPEDDPYTPWQRIKNMTDIRAVDPKSLAAAGMTLGLAGGALAGGGVGIGAGEYIRGHVDKNKHPVLHKLMPALGGVVGGVGGGLLGGSIGLGMGASAPPIYVGPPMSKAASKSGENCPSCGASMERGDDGKCNRCGKPWPEVKQAGAWGDLQASVERLGDIPAMYQEAVREDGDAQTGGSVGDAIGMGAGTIGGYNLGKSFANHLAQNGKKHNKILLKGLPIVGGAVGALGGGYLGNIVGSNIGYGYARATSPVKMAALNPILPHPTLGQTPGQAPGIAAQATAGSPLQSGQPSTPPAPKPVQPFDFRNSPAVKAMVNRQRELIDKKRKELQSIQAGATVA